MEKKKPSLKEYMIQQLQAINIVSEFISEEGMTALNAFQAEGDDPPRVLREAVCCLIDHMPAEQVQQLLSEGAPLGVIQEARRQHWQNLCAINDDLADQMQRKIEEASTAIEESNDARDAFWDRMDAAFSWAKEQAEKLQELQQEQINTLQQELADEKTMAAGLREQNAKLQTKIARLAERAEPETKHLVVIPPEAQDKTLFSRFREKKRRRAEKERQGAETESIQADMELFTEQVLNTGRYNDEQIAYLLSCLNDGLSTSQILKFAAPNYTVDIMKELRQTWEERGVL